MSFADLMKGPDREILQATGSIGKKLVFRQVGWIIGGGPRDGEFLPYNPDWRLPEQPGPHPRITERHGSFSPVYMEIGD